MAQELHEQASLTGITIHQGGNGELLAYAGHGAMGGLSHTTNCGGACIGGGIDVAIWEQEAQAEIASPATQNTRYWEDPGCTVPQSGRYYVCPETCTDDIDCDEGVEGNLARCAGEAPRRFCRTEHTSHVAAALGMVGSYSERGVSPPFTRAGTADIDIYVANEPGTPGLDWALSKPVVYLNRSQDTLGFTLQRLLDWAARYDDLLATLACGNRGLEDGPVVCQASFNTLGVGSYRYEVWNSRSDDRRSAGSSWINQTDELYGYLGLERPHLLGPGTFIDTSEDGGLHMPKINPSGMDPPNAMVDHNLSTKAIRGTSFAAPAVLSMAIQAHQYEGWLSYLSKPVMKKAVLLAGSMDANADGAICKGNVWSDDPDAEDGAGAPSSTYITQILANNRYAYLTLTDASFVSCGPGCREKLVARVPVAWTYSLRAALVYNACPEQNDAWLENDLDLVLLPAPGTSSCGAGRLSVNMNSETEMGNFKCTLSSGTIDIKIRIKNGDPLTFCPNEATEPVAVAWSIQP